MPKLQTPDLGFELKLGPNHDRGPYGRSSSSRAAAINCKMSLTSVVGERTRRRDGLTYDRHIKQSENPTKPNRPNPVEPGSASLKTPSLGPSPSSTLNALGKILYIILNML